jgi:asparagine synthase (glutamine-hydrolysing)
MILGVILRDPAPRPTWLRAPGSEGAATEGPARVHFGISGPCTQFRSDELTVVAESGLTSGSDASAVADAYRRFGFACVRHLRGRFRFLLHDAKAARVVAACSTAPSWPLAYWFDSRTAIVSSRLLSLLACPDVPCALDESYLVHLVMGLSSMVDGATAIRDVKRLCPGEALVVGPEGAHVERVDRLVPRDVRDAPKKLGPAFVEELSKVVDASIRPGRSVLSLSGGLDSAAIAAAGLRQTRQLAAFSLVAPGLDADAEAHSIDAMERAWADLRVARIDVSEATALPDLGPNLRDDPLLTPLALAPGRMRLWSKARDAGFQIVIEGEGGDELFSMLPTPLDALRRGHVLEAARHLARSSGRRALIQYGMWLPLLSERFRRAWLARGQSIETLLPAYASWDAGEHAGVRQAVDEYRAALVHRPFATRLNEWLSAPTFVGAMLSRRHLADAFGLELEWPMLERSVLELVLGLHAAGLIRGGPERAFLRSALAGIVPDEVRLRPKDVGLYRALIPRVLTSPRSREAVREARVKKRLADLVRFERVEAMLDGLAAGRELRGAALWQLECVVSFADWYSRASVEYGID